ncbi:MAG TPA: 7,8-didemethyl-8-hydroxy-5-deazariboflavin synthase subunit CofG [Leptolyngbyaceae cyanobacterium M33_DOE_097]|uniref:7,8-didemethyl-8-hydroxy-5-deazariboflavin synthase n=1 Tax=Oscillatoriales cyanobacterium SpSt-418 TaxID=2282169 RepID=A0A7C3PNF0_9CYAN|nr:7,8-didemethyl-8-hydroxy-5-deazariboflavin synthase subunit CofG [Leptolyngbyaceae cyanobacterium M33_DOE_097]
MNDKIVTYSPAYTVVPTYECFNRCDYCNFRADPGTSPWVSLAEVRQQLELLRSQGIIEILVLSGEVHPHSAQRRAWVEHIYAIAELALSMGFLPHTNAGPLSQTEMDWLKQVNVSMGLMVEQVTPRLLQNVHRHAPSKDPALRLDQLRQAGELRIPFTTGLLLGIGETAAERIETLQAIAQIHQQFRHIQEVILQPYRPGSREAWQGEGFSGQAFVEIVAIAREILPADITLQIPPNLVDTAADLLACLSYGVRDLGGIGPRDEVNPDYPHPVDHTLASVLATEDWRLIPRLPIYPAYDDWLEASLQKEVARYRQQLACTYHHIASS